MTSHELVYGHEYEEIRKYFPEYERNGMICKHCGLDATPRNDTDILLAILRELKRGNEVVTQGETKINVCKEK